MPIELDIQVHITELIRNPLIVRIASILDLASLSILELLEYNLERREINYALSEGVITIDKRKPTEMAHEGNILSGDSYFFNFLNSKVRLSKLGLYILDSIKGGQIRFEQSVDHTSSQYDVSMFNTPNIL